MKLRAARPDDAAFVTGLVPRFVEHGVAGGHSRDEVVRGTERVLRDALAHAAADELFLIAEDERAEPAGFVYAVTHDDFFTGEPYAHVSEIATVRSGDGVGTALMEAVERWARERGYRIVTLNVIEENTKAARFYERLAYGHHYRQLIKRW
jgi:GNAT superfamily N-acetyltransferase